MLASGLLFDTREALRFNRLWLVSIYPDASFRATISHEAQ